MNLANKIKDFLKNLLQKVREVYKKLSPDSFEGKYVREMRDSLSELHGKWIQGIKNATENLNNAKTGATKNTANNDGVKYSLNRNAKAELHKALYDMNYSEDVLLRDITPSIMLSQKGVKNLPMVMNISHIRENVFTEAEAKQLGLRVDKHTHYHGLGEVFYLKVIDGLDGVKEAYRGTKNADNSARRENYFLLVSQFKDNNGNVVNVPVYINETTQHNRVFIDTNKISTVFGRDNFRKYISNEISRGNLIKIKNKSTTSSEPNALIAERYRSNASNSIIPQGDNTVNNNSMQKDSKNSLRDKTYLEAVNSGDMETAQRMVDEAAKEVGYNSPMLYHGTKTFGFTRFELSKMDDKRCIFLTDSEDIASTYSGVEGTRRIANVDIDDIDNLSTKQLVEELNAYMDKYYKGKSEYAKYTYFDYNTVNTLISEVNSDIELLKSIVNRKLGEYEDDVKVYSQLDNLKSCLETYQYDKLSTPIYMLLHYSDVFRDDSSDIASKLETNVRIFNKVTHKDIGDGAVLKSMLGGYSLDLMYPFVAKAELKELALQGNYSMYANTDNMLVIDAEGQYWNHIYNWVSNIRLTNENTDVLREGDEFFCLLDNVTGNAIPESWLEVNEQTVKMNDSELKSLMINKARNVLAIRTENIHTTREIARFAQDHGYAGVIFKNLVDNGGQNIDIDSDTQANVYTFFDPSQIKSADPVTYDDNGDVIPLSKRFDEKNEDIRYSERITDSDIEALRNISKSKGRISVNDFNAQEIRDTEKIAQKLYRELGVKSPYFRAWFGDWRAYDTKVLTIATIKGDTRGVQRNIDTGWDINVSSKIFNETISHNASHNKKARAYLPYINDIVKNAVLLDTCCIDKVKSSNSLFMHSMYALADIGNGVEVLKLYVEEMNDPNSDDTRKRAYQLQDIKTAPTVSVRVQGSASSSLTSTVSAIRTVSDMHQFVKQHDSDFHPKNVNKILLNDNGTPKVFYHGSGQQFTEFKPEEMSIKEGSYFFAENKEDAQAYGRYIYEVYLTGKKLADYDNQSSEFYHLRDKRKQVDYLRKKGYDGWYADMDSEGWGEVSVFNPTQIKSATDNIGTFDSTNKDILYQARPDFSDILFDEFDGEVTDSDARLITEYIDGNADTISHILDKTKAIELTEPKIKSLVSRMLSSYDLSKR